ncbi:diguanylate cyclase domain-containing protein [Acidicapsa dinghuensis]|uniref:Diguanylate cyclase domain-containing protein n=1 Tax=Acidicapsa dinghuensis TaxID=2218256 RepID=A0ABW1EPV4_9BACT|nr:diguanylate cyclase [Acidicapsa dinghuensis]
MRYDSRIAMMQDSPNLLCVTLQLIRDAVVTADSEARVQALNPAAEALCGQLSSDASGKLVDAVFQMAADASVSLKTIAEEAMRAGTNGETVAAGLKQLTLLGEDGRRISVEVLASRYSADDGTGSGCVLVLHDTSRVMELAERISHSTQHDPLTGLPNRILLVDRLEQATKFADRNNEQLAVIFIGLDDLTRVRSEVGAAAGDALVREAAFRIGAVMRESDTVCRLGADEFVVLVPGVRSLSDVEAVATKLIDEFEKPYMAEADAIQTACSVGISVYPQDANDSATLMRLADGAMHQARGNEGSRCRFVNGAAGKV